MATAEELRRELDNIRQEIDDLREQVFEIELALGAVHSPLRWLRAPGARLHKRDIEVRIQSLKLRHNIVHNCYLTVKRDEARLHPEVRSGKLPSN